MSIKIIETENGKTVLCNGKYLYSKYSPSRAAMQIIDNVNIPQKTIVVVASPCLCYGLQELMNKIQNIDAFVVAIECDPELHGLATKNLPNLDSKKFALLAPTVKAWSSFIDSLMQKDSTNWGRFKHVVRINLSAGWTLHTKEYLDFTNTLELTIAQFYKNALTYARFGKRYCLNFFKNLAIYAKGDFVGDLSAIFNSIKKPILVIGAGDSCEAILAPSNKKILENCFIIAVDAIAPLLSKCGVHTDCIVCEESQSAIRGSFVGTKADYFVKSLSSTPMPQPKGIATTLFYTTIFADLHFIDNIAKKIFLPAKIPPMGSVGLTATYIATKLRKNDEIPIFVAGLDFSFKIGKTHARSSFPINAAICKSNRLHPAENYQASFCYGTLSAKNLPATEPLKIITTKLLSEYAALFRQLFSTKKNLYDVRNSSEVLPLGLPAAKLSDYVAITKKVVPNFQSIQARDSRPIFQFLQDEASTLGGLVDMCNDYLSSTQRVDATKLSDMIFSREYLFLHFGDYIDKARTKSIDREFCNRIRFSASFFKEYLTFLAARV